jgi:hypothetical protein
MCLSQAYTNLDYPIRWRCARGHEWSSRPRHIVNGHWCPTCNSKKHDIAFMQALARDRGGICLSTIALGMHVKLHWRCAEGHTWWAKPHALKSNGSWCPTCWALRRGAVSRERWTKMREDRSK